jgi:hypothetical protein
MNTVLNLINQVLCHWNIFEIVLWQHQATAQTFRTTWNKTIKLYFGLMQKWEWTLVFRFNGAHVLCRIGWAIKARQVITPLIITDSSYEIGQQSSQKISFYEHKNRCKQKSTSTRYLGHLETSKSYLSSLEKLKRLLCVICYHHFVTPQFITVLVIPLSIWLIMPSTYFMLCEVVFRENKRKPYLY